VHRGRPPQRICEPDRSCTYHGGPVGGEGGGAAAGGRRAGRILVAHDADPEVLELEVGAFGIAHSEGARRAGGGAQPLRARRGPARGGRARALSLFVTRLGPRNGYSRAFVM